MKWLAKRQFCKGTWSLVAVLALALIDGQAVGQCQLDKLLASDGAAVDRFGLSVSISGAPGNEIAIVGAFGSDINGAQSGSAYIYRFNGTTWVEEQKLLASDGAAGDWFGISVSISGTPGNEIAIVGAYKDDDNGTDSGSAYIYRFNGATWVEEDKLLASDGIANDKFGQSVSISGTPGNEVATVGAIHTYALGWGESYIYRKSGTTWVEEDVRFASDGAAGDYYGWSISISGAPGNEIVLVGSLYDDDNGADSGSAYIYRFNGVNWVEEAKLLASDGAFDDWFGSSVSIGGTTGNEIAIVGARNHDDTGSAYIYRFNGANWIEEAKLLASDGATGDKFGVSVSITGTPGNEIAIVGAWGHADNGLNSGSAYIYRFNGVTWVEEPKFLAADGTAGDLFGHSVSISGDVALVGASVDDDNGSQAGSAYVFTGLRISGLSGDCNSNGINDLHDLFLNKTSPDCNDNGIPDECDIASGVSLDVDGNGIPDECLASCPPDINTDGNVNVTDLLALLASWGACP